MRKRRPVVSGSLVLVALIALSAVAQAGSFGTYTFSTGKKIGTPDLVQALARAAGSGGVSPSREMARAPKPEYTCVPSCDALAGLTLIGDGELRGLGSTDGTVLMNSVGSAVVECTNQGGNAAPGQNLVLLSAEGASLLEADNFSKNGTTNSTTSTTYTGQTTNLPGDQWGCANANWTASIVTINWIQAKVTVYQSATEPVIAPGNITACKVFTFRPEVNLGSQALTCPSS